MQTITSLGYFQSRKIDLKTFLGVIRSSRLFWSVDHQSTVSYLNVHSDQPVKLREAQVFSRHTSLLFLLMEVTPGRTHFSPVMFIKEWVLCKIMCHSVTKGRWFNWRSCDLHFYVPDLNCGHDWLSANFSFLSVTLWPLNNTEKKLVHSLFLIMLEILQ